MYPVKSILYKKSKSVFRYILVLYPLIYTSPVGTTLAATNLLLKQSLLTFKSMQRPFSVMWVSGTTVILVILAMLYSCISVTCCEPANEVLHSFTIDVLLYCTFFVNYFKVVSFRSMCSNEVKVFKYVS